MRNPDYVPITDFFGSVRPVNLLSNIRMQPIISIHLEINTTTKRPKKYRYIPPLVNFNTVVN